MLHDGQRRVNGEPHSTQNFARSGFSAAHFEQRNAPLSLEPYGASALLRDVGQNHFQPRELALLPRETWPAACGRLAY